MNFATRIRTRFAVAACLVAGLVSCTDAPTAVTDRGHAPRLEVALLTSSATAPAGRRIAVAVQLGNTIGNVGGIQGTLRFDPARLRYVGQSPIADVVTMVNPRGADAGSVRFMALSPHGVSKRVALFVFEPLTSGYMSAIEYVHEMAATSDPLHRTIPVTVQRTATVDARLLVPIDVRRALSVADWAARIAPVGRRNPQVSAAPGEYSFDLRYGDVDFSGAVDLNDYLSTANAAVGNDELIIGTNVPGTDVDIVIAGNVSPDNGNGACGTEANGDRIIDLNDALAIANWPINGGEPCIGERIPGRGLLSTLRQSIGAATSPGLVINAGSVVTLTRDRTWELEGPLHVRSGGRLVIEKGARIEGRGAPVFSAIFVERGGVIEALGTLYEPIIMTCVAAQKAPGCWGGVFIAGRGTLNRGDPTLGSSPDGCTQNATQLDYVRFGGCDNVTSSGILTYVRIEYAGALFRSSEMSGLTLAAVGRLTQVDHVQVHGGSEDGIEIIGGGVASRYVLLTGNDDDQFVISSGNNADHQFVITQQSSSSVSFDSRAIQADGNNPTPGDASLPRTSPGLWNFTIVGNFSAATQPAAIQLRRATGLKLYNSIVAGSPIGADYDDALTVCDAFDGGIVRISHTTFVGVANLGDNDPDPVCPGATATNELEEQQIRSDTMNAITATPIASIFKDAYAGPLPDFRIIFRPDSFARLDRTLNPQAIPGSTALSTTFRGAAGSVRGGGFIPWYSGWTRGLSFGGTP